MRRVHRPHQFATICGFVISLATDTWVGTASSVSTSPARVLASGVGSILLWEGAEALGEPWTDTQGSVG